MIKSFSRSSGAVAVASGMLISRLLGLVRERVLAQVLGVSPAADALRAAIRIPNLLQNLLGEGVLSASFIPAYSKLLGDGEYDRARRLALSLLSVILVLVTALVCVGVYFSSALVTLIAPGFTPETKDLTAELLRILFPATGLLVVSAWCLGVHNSNRRFFISYVAPAFWNLVIICTVYFYARGKSDVAAAMIAALGYLIGAGVQILVQIPQLLGTMKGIALRDFREFSADLSIVLKRFVPAFFGRGVVQISAYVDNIIASLIGPGSVALLSIVQTVYLLPISLFGMSIAASELPELSRSASTLEVLSERLGRARKKIILTVLPTTFGFMILGDLILTILFKGGRFNAADVQSGWFLLATLAIGLLASTLGRLSSSTLYALGDTSTPMRIAVIRVTISALLAIGVCLILPIYLPVLKPWSLTMLGIAASIGGVIESGLLRQAVQRAGVRIGSELRLLFTVGLGSVALLALVRYVYFRFIIFSV